MHPIEHLRYLARSGDPDPEWLLPEAAAALTALADDQPSLIMGCRQLVEHQPWCGPLWWLCTRVVTTDDVHRAIRSTLDEFSDDPTALQVSLELSDRDESTGPLVLTALIAGPQGAFVPARDPGSSRLEATVDRGEPVWLVAGVGRVVAPPIFDQVVDAPDAGEATFLPAEHIARVVGPGGSGHAAVQLARCDVPYSASLAKRS